MSALLVFELAGPPLPWQRAGSYNGKRYTSPEQRNYQRALKATARATMPTWWPTDLRYDVAIEAHVKPVQRGDVDNIAKQVLDGLNACVWNDDRQVDRLRIVRFVDKANPRLVVRVRTIEDAS